MTKKTVTKLIALLLVLAMSLALFTGCAKTSEAPKPADSAAPAEEKKGEPDQVTFAYFCTAVIPADVKKIEQAMSDYAREKINVEIKLVPLSIGTYNQQINLMISGGEKLDIFNMFAADFNSSMAQNKLYPLSKDMVNEYAPGVVESLGDYMVGTTVGENVYGFGVMKDMAAARGIYVNQEVLAKHGLSMEGIETPDELTALFEKLHELEPDLTLVCSEDIGKSVMDSGFATYDDLGDRFGVLMNYGETLEVVNLFETEWYKDTLDYIRDWYVKGYTLADNSINPDTGLTILKARDVFGQLGNGHFATAAVVENMIGMPCEQALLAEPFSNTATINGVIMSIPATCKDPIPALKVLNLMYSDPNFINLIDWGIEGEHYVRVEGTENCITYPEGVNADNSGYAMAASWEFGSEMLAYVWENQGDDYHENMIKFNDSARKSKALGFVFDSTPVKTEVAALNNVLNEYRLGLENGEMDPDVYLPKFQEALRDAGIDKVIAEKQKQLDEWASIMGIS